MRRTSRRSGTLRDFGFFLLTLLAATAWGPQARAQNTAVPLVNQPLVPDAIAPGGPAFTLRVNGTGFVSGATVKWNGVALATTFVSGSQLQAKVPAPDIAVAGSALVTVLNPGDGAASNAAIFQITAPYPTISFGQSSYATTGIPTTIVTADFNGDGNLDLAATVGQSDGTEGVGVLLGNGDGTFSAVRLFPGGGGGQDLKVGDVNGDGVPDLLVLARQTNTAPPNLTAMLGNGDGSFGAPIVFDLDADSYYLAVGDFDADGRLDVAVSQLFAARVQILLGNGDGTFRAHQAFGGKLPFGMAVGDFNRDGKLDLAVANGTVSPGAISIVLGNGDGTFQAPITLSGGFFSSVLLTADLNGDGYLDLAGFSGTVNGPVDVFLGKGDGTFQRPVQSPTRIATQQEVVGDFNGDGVPDLAVSGYDNDPNARSVISVLLGKGDGTFQTPLLFGTGVYNFEPIAAGDFNRDGRLDLALSVADDFNAPIFVLLSSPLTFSPPALVWSKQQLVSEASPPETTTVTNTGSRPASISSINIGGKNGQDFAEQTNTCGASIPPGGTCAMSLVFTPSDISTRSGILEVASDAVLGTQNVILTGMGTYVKLVPTSLNFGSVAVGNSSSPQAVTLTNTSSVTIGITNIFFGGSDQHDYSEINNCGSSVPAHASCTIKVTFSPQKTGLRKASLILLDSGGPQQNVPLRGFGEPQ